MGAAVVPSLDTPPLLELRDVDAAYGPFRSLFGVSFDLHAGRVLALLGSNGAGKTTVARVCSGLLKPTAGSVWFDGSDVTKWRTFLYPRLGIVLAPEGRSVFATLTVAENLELTFRRSKGRAGVKPALEKAYDMVPRLGERRYQIAGTLSGGEQRMLSLSRVIVEQPRVLIADELSLGLAPIIVDEVYGVLATIRDAGTTLLIIEQHVHHALNIADDAIVLVKGEVAYSGPVSELGDLQARVLGETPET
jgi:branched-chain amino acid transport system ATP-binding protein